MKLSKIRMKVLRWAAPVLVTVSTAIIISGILSCFVLPKMYMASTTLIINVQDNKDTGTLSIEQLVKVYTAIAKSDSVKNKLIDELGLPEEMRDKWEEKVSINADSESGLIHVNVKDKNAQSASDISNYLAEVFQYQVMDILSYDNLQIVDRASVPKKPVKPNILFNILASGAAGMVIVSAIILAVENLDDTIKDQHSLKSHKNIPFLGTVPKLPGSYINHIDISGFIADIFMVIRANIISFNRKKIVKIMLVTNPDGAKENSIIAANIAISMAQYGKKVMLLDFDIRKPHLHKYFNFENSEGLCNILGQREAYTKFIKRIDVPNLDIITGGPAAENPIGLLSCSFTKELIYNLKVNYDLAVIAAPPILITADNMELLSIVDGVVLTANYGKTTNAVMEKVLDTLKKMKASLLGILIFNVPKKHIDEYRLYKDYIGD